MEEKSLKVRFQADEIMFYLVSFGLGISFCLLLLYFTTFDSVIIYTLFIASIRFFVYKYIDFVVPRSIYFNHEGFCAIRFAGVKLGINTECAFMRIEDMVTISKIGAKHPALILYRNNKGIVNRIFKNRIKLYKVEKDNREFVFNEIQKISTQFGITFRDTYDLDNDS